MLIKTEIRIRIPPKVITFTEFELLLGLIGIQEDLEAKVTKYNSKYFDILPIGRRCFLQECSLQKQG